MVMARNRSLHGESACLCHGTRQDVVFLKLQALLAPFGITRYYTDKSGTSRRYLLPTQHTVGKLSMQKIERKHFMLRTRLKRLARKTLGFSRSCFMHDLLVGFYMNHVEFGGRYKKRIDTKMEHYLHIRTCKKRTGY